MITPQTSHNKRSHFIPSTSNSDSYGALRYRISFYLYQKGDRSFKTIPKKRFLRSASLSHFILPTSNSDRILTPLEKRSLCDSSYSTQLTDSDKS
ncbi:MAG: hypothetical protein ACKPJO_22410 [Dolichospermum sp.]